MPPADLEIVEVVRRRDLHRAGAFLRIGIVVADIGMHRPPAAVSQSPIRCFSRSFSGCTATAVSPRMVSGRVVATTINSSLPSIGYLMCQSDPWFRPVALRDQRSRS